MDRPAPAAAFALSRAADAPLAQQLSARFAERIRQRLLAPGARLPSVRECARRHGVSPTTVVAAYDQLLAQGLVEARRQRGFFVREPRPASRAADARPAANLPTPPIDATALIRGMFQQSASAAPGMGALLLALPPLRWALKVFGVAYLLWLAWKLWHAGRLGHAEAPLRVGYGQGVLLQFVNIKAWMLALTITAGWIALPQLDRGQALHRLALVLAVMAVYAFVSNFVYAAAGALLRRWLWQGRRLLAFNRVLAALLAGTAAWMGFA
jgi:DNA-binding transcriptional regulator YhcF (GntR family)/threonine/homoserine/homoserine lactone efflux protein